MDTKQHIDLPTIAGIALLLMPLLTMAHEIGGHVAACVAVGGKLRELGAFYVECDTANNAARRIVALAGMGMDAALALISFQLWRRCKSDLAQLICWFCWLCFAFSAAGYFLFSGVSGIGDLGPGEGGGIGPLPWEWLWRVAFAVAGGIVYWKLVGGGIAALNGMIGQGLETRPARRKIAHGFYFTLCLSAVLASIPNPVGLVITLTSATAASFGGKAGMISIGFSAREGGETLPFTIARNWLLIIAGILASGVFVAVLGPTLRFAAG